MLHNQKERLVIDMTLTPTIINEDSKPQTMDFYDALKRISEGKSVTRISWANKDYCFMKDGWLTIFTKNSFHTWSVNDGDMEGQDWVIVKELN